MSKFNKGDRARLEDGREGTVISIYSSAAHELDGATCLRIGNKLETWHEDGLTKIEEPELDYNVGDILYLEVRIISVGASNLPYPYEIQPLCDDVKFWATPQDVFKKEDIINE